MMLSLPPRPRWAASRFRSCGLGFAAAFMMSPLSAAPLVVAFNADDDNGNAIRDCDEPYNDADNDVVVAWRVDEPAESLRVRCEAPAGAIRFAVAPDRTRVFVEALRPAAGDWDGRFTLVIEPGAAGPVSIRGRVAPLLVRSSLAPARAVFVREFPGRNEVLVEQLKAICRQAGAELRVVPAGEPYAYNHIWLQDTVEFLEAQTEPPMTVALAGVRDRPLDLFARDRLLGASVGYLQVGRYRDTFARGEGGVSWIDWYGNLEASPPTPSCPHGCVLYGVDSARDAQLHPAVVAMLGAQGKQPVVPIDVGWLTIKHVDEMVAFVPATGGGFLTLVPDPTLALSVLRDLRAKGHGGAALLDVFEDGVTIDSVLDDAGFVAANQRLWRERIEPMSRELLDNIGADAETLVRLPVLFHPNGTPRTPNVVNCLVLPGPEGGTGHVAMADPNGPVIDGEDALQAATRKRLAGAAVELHFVDDRQYHKWSGNVHCATNAIRPLGGR